MKGGMANFTEHCQRHSETLSKDVAMAWEQEIARVRGLVIQFNEQTVEAAMSLEANGRCIFREQKHTIDQMKQFRVGKERIKEYQTTFERLYSHNPGTS